MRSRVPFKWGSTCEEVFWEDNEVCAIFSCLRDEMLQLGEVLRYRVDLGRCDGLDLADGDADGAGHWNRGLKFNVGGGKLRREAWHRCALNVDIIYGV
jgi:hypothetical protein